VLRSGSSWLVNRGLGLLDVRPLDNPGLRVRFRRYFVDVLGIQLGLSFVLQVVRYLFEWID